MQVRPHCKRLPELSVAGSEVGSAIGSAVGSAAQGGSAVGSAVPNVKYYFQRITCNDYSNSRTVETL